MKWCLSDFKTQAHSTQMISFSGDLVIMKALLKEGEGSQAFKKNPKWHCKPNLKDLLLAWLSKMVSFLWLV